MPADYHHGVRVIEVNDGPRPIRTTESAVIGVIVTAPDAQPALAASVTIGSAAADTGLVISAANAGLPGNLITLTLVDPKAASQALAVTVNGNDISVSLATGADSALTSTAADVLAALNTDAAALVSVSHDGDSDGSAVMPYLRKVYLEGGEDEPFPLDTAVLVAGSRTKAAKLDHVGDGRGTGPRVMEAIFKQTAPVMIVVRVEEGVDDAETTSNVIGGVDPDGTHRGAQALLTAKTKFKVGPRIIGAPGLDTEAVTAELLGIADQTRGFVYSTTDGALNPEQAVAFRDGFGQKRGMALFGHFLNWNTDTNSEDVIWASAAALGLRARIDADVGWHKTLSNIPVSGVTGIDRDISWDLQNPNTVAGYLNANEVTTLIQYNGRRFWGSRTYSEDPMFAFESAVRTGDILADTIAEAHMWAIDKPMSKTLIDDIIEGINAKFRELKALGYIVDGQAWLDPEINDEMTLAAGKLYVDYDYTPVPPLENLMFRQRITTRYLSQLVK